MSDSKYRNGIEDYYDKNVAEAMAHIANKMQECINEGLKNGLDPKYLMNVLTLGAIFDNLTITNMLLARLLENIEPATKEPLDLNADLETKKF